MPLVQYEFDVDGAETNWRVRKVVIREAISEPYECILDLVHDAVACDPTALENVSCTLRIGRGEATRRICGLVFCVECLGTVIDHVSVRVHLAPALAALEQTRNSRIFQNRSVAEILQAVLTDGLAPYQRAVELDLDRSYPPREYCVQYGESDLDFSLRLMSEEGIFFRFDHSGEQELLVLVDANRKCPRLTSPAGGPIAVVGPEAPQELLDAETIGRLAAGRRLRTTSVILRDYDWTRPKLDLTYQRRAPDAQGLERTVYEYPAVQVIDDYDRSSQAYTRYDGTTRVRLRQEALEAGTRFAEGEGNVTGLAAGQVLEVDGQHLPQLGTRYLVTHVEHTGHAEEALQHDGLEARLLAPRYQNRFTCASFDLPYRPQPARRSVISGAQTATVVGPAGEEIHTDEHGRVKVQFHWDRAGKRDEASSAWIRVMQPWAGGGFGAVFLPRIGMEVVVQFLEGDPDRPLVVGCVYNAVNPPDGSLPREKTRTSLTTRSSPGGGGYNQLVFEDASGAEEISLRAQKDLRAQILNDRAIDVGHDETAEVGHDRTARVGNDQTSQVGNDNTTTIGGKEVLSVGASRAKTVGASEQSSIGADQKIDVAGSQSLSVGSKQSIQVGGMKTESVGGLSLENVGGAKTLTVGAAYAVTVGGAMNTAVGGVSLEEVGLIKIVKAGTKLELSCGGAKIVLESGGKVTIAGTEFEFVASGDVTLKGALVAIN